MSTPRRHLRMEPLESRRVFASDWQSSPNPLDVDNSGFVVALDALQVINDINENGNRELPATRPINYTGPLCDTTGDNHISAVDALQIINAINQFPDAPTLNINLTDASDLNGDGVVLNSNVAYEGSSSPNIKYTVEKVEGEQATPLFDDTADADGNFNVPITLTEPITHLRFTVSDPRGRSLSTERIVRKGDVVTAWNAALLEVVRETTAPSSTVPGLLIKPPPPMVAKYLAMVHGAMFDAMNAVTNQYEAYAFNTAPQSGASPIAAAAAAAHRVASNVYNTTQEIAFWDKTLNEVLNTLPQDNARALGIDLGHQAGDAMIAERQNDGSSATVTYTPGTDPGDWRPTPPNFAAATLPQWPEVTPFAMTSGDQFRPAAPPSLSSAEYAAAVNQVKNLGSSTSDDRTADQTKIALFWADAGGTSTPPGHWNQIAIDIGLEQNQSPLLNARMMALLNYALADAGIASWDAKYAYDLWRPIDAIRQAASDGNAATTADSTWTPLIGTPSFPSYTSGHSTFSAAAAAVLTQLLGNMSFTTMADPGSTGLWPPSDDVSLLQTRSFTSFTQAAEEAGMSRIYGGIHYSFDNVAGQASGQQIGQLVTANLLKPRLIVDPA